MPLKPFSYAPQSHLSAPNLGKGQGVLQTVLELPDAEILIIEDEHLMSALMQRYLKGLSTTEFGAIKRNAGPLKVLNLESGWELLNSDLSHIKVAIVDILLPQVNGVDLLRDFKRRYPHMGLLPISGMATEPMKRNLKELLPEGVELLNKPLRREEFIENFKKAWTFSQGQGKSTQAQTPLKTNADDLPSWTAGISHSQPLEVVKRKKLPKLAA